MGDQPDLPALSGRRAHRPQAAGSPQGRGDPCPDPSRGDAERALVAGFRPRPIRQRSALPHPQHRRRRHQGMSGRHSGYVDLRTTRRSRTDGRRPTTRQARNDRVRPRHRVHLQCHARLVQGRSYRLALHCTGKADAERLLESFNGRMRDELLNETLFFDLDHARAKIANWVADYNLQRPHSSLKYMTPAAYAAHLTATDDRLRNPDQLRRSSVAPTAPLGVQSSETLTAAG